MNSPEIKLAKDISLDNIRIASAVYGPTGSGKTVLGATYPAPIFLDLNGGILSIRGTNASYIQIRTEKDHLSRLPLYSQSWDLLERASNKAIDSDEHQSIIIDSMTEIGEMALGRAQVTNGRLGKNPNFDDWAGLFSLLRDYVVKMRDCGKHVLFIAHEKIEKNELTGQVWITPSIQGQMREKFSTYFDEFYHSEVSAPPGKNAKYRLLIRSNELYTAKSRLLPKSKKENYIEPSFNSMMALIK